MLKITDPTMVLAELLAGVFLLLYGVRLVSDAVQQAVRGHMRQALPWLSKNPFAAFGIGIVATGLLQSSSAMAVLLVELVSADLLSLSVAVVILLGANVGSTLVVQLLALPITDYALEIVGLAAVVTLFTHRTVYRRAGRALFAFSLVMLGLGTIKAAGDPIAQNHITRLIIEEGTPLFLFLVGVVLAMVLNSSAATIGLVLPLAANGVLALPSALALMLGANVGTTLLAMFASLKEGTLAGRRLALIHCGTKLAGATVLLIFISPLSTLLSQVLPHNPTAQVALTHLAFNLALALIFAPLSGPLARLLELLLPLESNRGVLNTNALSTPVVARGLVTREMLRMADVVPGMFELSILAFKGPPETIQARIEAMDAQLDDLGEAIKGYLTQLNEEASTDILLTIVGDLEAIGDIITQRLMSLARRRARSHIFFSEEGRQDLEEYHRLVGDALQQVLAALVSHNLVLAAEFLARKQELKRIKRDFHLRHIHRLRSGNVDSQESSAIHLDVLHVMNNILVHTSNIAHALRELPIQTTALEITGALPKTPAEVPSSQVAEVLTETPVQATALHVAYALQETQFKAPALHEVCTFQEMLVNGYLLSGEAGEPGHPLVSTGQFIGVKGQMRK